MGFIYEGQHIRSDAPGNIHYGYVGAAAEWKTSTLMYAAGTVQQFSGGNGLPAAQSAFFYGDNPVDQANVLWGINMYYNR
jgi:hypothetical protein